MNMKYTVSYGANNYFCMRRWENFDSAQLGLNVEYNRAVVRLEKWLHKTKTGLRQEISAAKGRGVPNDVWNHVCREPDYCSKECSRHDCFYRRAKKRESESHIVIVNHHLLMGYTHKKWNTQGDARVRDDKKANHVAMQGVTIPIKNKFRVAGGGTGLYPGDPQLPPRQRINCRCFLTFVRRS